MEQGIKSKFDAYVKCIVVALYSDGAEEQAAVVAAADSMVPAFGFNDAQVLDAREKASDYFESHDNIDELHTIEFVEEGPD